MVVGSRGLSHFCSTRESTPKYMGLVFGRRLLYHTRGIHFPPRSPGFAGSVDSRKLSGGRKAPKRAEDCPDLGAANEGNGSGTCRVSRGLQNSFEQYDNSKGFPINYNPYKNSIGFPTNYYTAVQPREIAPNKKKSRRSNNNQVLYGHRLR